MLIKTITLIVSSFLILFGNLSLTSVIAADCEEHLSRPGANRAKEMARKRKAMKKLDKQEQIKLN